jgi:D-serine deaminase-like pyridoxal phosphate-dependent protein
MTDHLETAPDPGAPTAGPDWRARVEGLAHADGLEQWPTPLLALDLDTLEANIARMAAAFADRPGGVRPHVKTHKCTEIGRLQAAAHGRGLTCSTTDEVTAIVAAGIDDVLLANVVSDPLRVRALVAEARRATITVAVDSLEVVELLEREARAAGTPVGVVVERDIGMGRNGVTSMADGVLVAEAAAASPWLRLRGVMAYEGHLVDRDDRAERSQLALAAMEDAVELLLELRRRGHEAPMFTGGSTATYDSTGMLAEMTDVQAGTYVLMDEVYRTLTPEFEPALALVATVLTSRPDGTLVLDAGAKRLGTDWGEPRLIGVEAEFRYTAEEHTVLGVLEGRRPRVGERVALLPGHACTTMSLHRAVHACRAGVVERQLAIDARDPLT